MILPAASLKFFCHNLFEGGRRRQGRNKVLVCCLLENIMQQGAGGGAAREGVDATRQGLLFRHAVLIRLFGQLVAARVRRGQGFLNLLEGTVAGNPPGLALMSGGHLYRFQGRLPGGRLIRQIIALRWRDHAYRVADDWPQCFGEFFIFHTVTKQQAANGTFLQLVGFTVAFHVGGNAQGAGMAGPGECHIEQAHVFRQALFVSLALVFCIRLQ